ncbi:hypothetical protein RclHR1_00740009 [Rhizophagus clarus]|uniref:Uncharacterized protein n=1 Tax=Rhizophagus clarus TaxID=94130 RepID=A0A2Z6RWK6_9GLOM|nr:hypothetical protein RclHR1_00740009 [Rhizophagus clarus]GES79701.1 hypothetical protein GLOIN_2v1791047 [Rhizophagus clarus]
MNLSKALFFVALITLNVLLISVSSVPIDNSPIGESKPKGETHCSGQNPIHNRRDDVCSDCCEHGHN